MERRDAAKYAHYVALSQFQQQTEARNLLLLENANVQLSEVANYEQQNRSKWKM